MKKLLFIFLIIIFYSGCSLPYFYGGASTFNNPSDYQWVKTSDGRVIPVKKEDAWRYSQ
jgi:hypothetical protein